MNAILSQYLYDLEFVKHEVTIKTRIKPLNHFFDFLADEFGLDCQEDLTTDHIDRTNIDMIKKYALKLEDLNYAIRTIRERLIFVKSFYTHYIDSTNDRMPMHHPFDGFELPKKTSKEIKLLSADEYIDFVENLTYPMEFRNKSIVIMLMTSGIKLKKLVELKISDIIFNDDNEPIEMISEGRTIPLNKAISISLKTYLEGERKIVPFTKEDNLFVSRKCTPIHVSTIQLMLRERAKKQNKDQDALTAYALRSFAITTYRQYGGGDTGIKDFFGKSIYGIQFETTNKEPFLNNPVIDKLYSLYLC